MRETSSERPRFAVLDGLRGVAALTVIADHVESPMLHRLLPSRDLAVDFFFVLSGFVLTHAYFDRLSANMSPGSFMRARLIRLYPLYLLGSVIGMLVVLYAYVVEGQNPGRLNLLATSFFAASFLPCPPLVPRCGGEPFPLNGPAWSLFFELAANLAFAFLAPHLNARRLAAWLFLAAAALGAAVFVYGKIDIGWAWSHFAGGAARVGFSFFAGVFIYLNRARWRLPALPAWVMFGLFFAIVVAPVSGLAFQAFDLIAVLVFIPVLVAIAGRAQVKGLSLRICDRLGAASYGIYMLHVPLLRVADTVLGLKFSTGIVEYLFIAGVAVAAAVLADSLYDLPIRRALTRLFARAPATPA